MTAFPEMWSDPDVVDSKLMRDFGVTSEPFRNALNRARLEWATCTENDPPNLPGTIFWGATVRYLREELLATGWTKADPRNFSLVLSPDGSKAISVATGSDDTGSTSSSANPTTKSPKGPATIDAVETNEYQLELFAEPGQAPPQRRFGDDAPLTYIFLIRIDRGRISAELSLPLTMGPDGRPLRWRERMVIPMGDEGENEPTGYRRRGPEPGPDVEVSITRRTG
jgi:hypothetical protein